MQIRATSEYQQYSSIKTSMQNDDSKQFSATNGGNVERGDLSAEKDSGGDDTAMDVDGEDGEVPANENDGDVEMRDAEKIEENSRDQISEGKEPKGATEMAVDDNGEQDLSANDATTKEESTAAEIEAAEKPPVNSSAEGSSASKPLKTENETNDNTPGGEPAKTENKENGTNPSNGGTTDAPNPPPPVMKGTLSIDVNGQNRRHLIRGMWNYENSNAFAPQRFELVRTLSSNEDENTLPLDGEFHGSFSLTYVTTNSKGKRKERSKVVPETGVKIKFTKKDSEEYEMEGRGTNQFGCFRIFGSAKPTPDPNDPTMSIMFRKLYEPGPNPANADGAKKKSDAADAVDSGPLPDPSESFQRGVVSLRGKLVKDEMHETDVVHRISGLWAQGLDFIVSDPENTKGLCDRFEYEHKSAVPTSQFPVSGKYSGWFEILDEDGTRKKINERDVTLRFKPNNAGYHNVEGKGSNVFGRYTITGTFTAERTLTIFRHFQQRKIKAKAPQPAAQVVAAPVVPSTLPALPATPNLGAKLKLEDVDIPGDGLDKSFDAIDPPKLGAYSAVSRGVFRSNDDGSHSCQGKWASTREMFDTGQTLPMTFRLEPHHATEAALTSPNNRFPLDSVMYKGSFNMKKGARAQAVVDKQVVMKFRKNKQGAYNVHGKGVNSIGEFNLIGSLILQGASAGQVELYRVYPPSKLATAVVPPKTPSGSAAADTVAPNAIPRGPAQQGLARRGSSRTVKAPMWLEEDDPNAQISRTLDKCGQILKYLRDKDVEFGGFFGQPVDPIAMRIPTYFQVVKEPMDLKTIARKMEAGTVATPADFKRLVSLVFENAITFNIDPNHSVHKAARTLLGLFNQKFRDVERSIDSIRRTHGVEVDFEKGGPVKAGSKRGRGDDSAKSLKRIRLDEAQRMASANASAITAIVAAAPATVTSSVTRSEFNMLLNLIQQIQRQVVDTHKAVAELTPEGSGDRPRSTTSQANKRPSAAPQKKVATAAKTEKAPKKAPVRRTPVPERNEPVVVLDDSTPLSMEEQVLLMDTINELPQEHLGGVMQIIREAASVDAEEDEIDLEIDQLDVKTQRKLLRHVSKFVKKPKKTKKPKQQPIKRKADKPPEATGVAAPKKSEKEDAQESKAAFFAFGGDSESDQEDDKPATAPATGASDFKLESLELADDDDDEDIGEESIAANWNFPKETKTTEKKESGDDDDDDWGAAAREQAAAAKARDADRKAREQKKKADAEQASKERLADAAARGEEIKAQRAEEQAREASKREEKEREAELAREAAKAKAKAQLETVEQTVDLDEQRDIMKQYELSDTGGASPSSDFGF